jgi:hypothetical protein
MELLDLMPTPAAARLYGEPLVLPRPDHHVARRGHAVPANADDIIDTITGARAYAPTESSAKHRDAEAPNVKQIPV